MLIEHHHLAFLNRHRSDAVAHIATIKQQSESAVMFIAECRSLIGIIRDGNIAQRCSLLLAVIPIGYSLLFGRLPLYVDYHQQADSYK